MSTEIQIAPPSGMALLAELSRKVTDPAAAMEIARQIVDLETKWETLRQNRDRFEWEKGERESRVAYAAAFKQFKEDSPKILKTKHVYFESKKEGQAPTSYYHVELDKACDLLIPALLKVGITNRWKSSDLPDGRVRVTCFLRHEMGHEEEGSSLAGPADQSGGKNPIQGIGSSTSYLERYTFLATCGIVASGADNDGLPEGITTGEGADMVNAIKTATDPIIVMGAWKVAVDAAKKFTPIDYKALTIFTEARDERLKSLKKEQA